MTTQSHTLYQELLSKGFPEDLCREIAYRQLTTDYTVTRMLGYLYRQSATRVEDVVDEMLAILSDRDSLVQKHEMQQAQAKLNELYNSGLFDDADNLDD